MFVYTKVRSLFKDGKQTAGCTEFHTETGLCSLVSVQKLEHSAVCLPTLKRERTLVNLVKALVGSIFVRSKPKIGCSSLIIYR